MSAETQRAAAIADGGFRIEILPDSLTIAPDSKAHEARTRSAFKTVLFGVGCFFAALYAILVILPQLMENGRVFLLVLAVLLGPSLLWQYFRGVEHLTCTRESITLTRFARNKVRGTRCFSRDSVKQLRFGAVGYARYGAINGLVFDGSGKKIKTLPHLQSPEAQTVLKEFERLGYDVIHDVGMAMMVEMALERRKSGIL